MKQAITGYHQDDEQHWIAELQCGHCQHVRHDPPWQNRPWVLSPEGRTDKLGAELECRQCEMPRLPDTTSLLLLNTSTTLNETTVPTQYCENSQLPADIWLELSLHSGQLQLLLGDADAPQGFLLDTDFSGCIPPQTTFRLKICGPVRFTLRVYEFISP